MGSYILKAISPKGKPIAVRREGSAPADVVQRLGSQGFQQIVLLTDDIQSVIEEMWADFQENKDESQPKGGHPYRIPPQTWICNNTLTPFEQFRFQLRKIIPLEIFALLMAMFIVHRIAQDGWEPWKAFLVIGWFGLGGVGTLLGLVLVAVLERRYSSQAKVRRFYEDISWHRWDRVLSHIPEMQSALIPVLLTTYHSKALAGQGKLAEAEALLKPLENSSNMPPWFYFVLLNIVYSTSPDSERFLQSLQQARSLAPDRPAILIDLAMFLVRFRQDFPGALEILQQINPDGVTELNSAELESVYGAIALEEGNHSAARERFERALRILKPYSHSNPMARSMMDVQHGYIALAYIKLGDITSARKHFQHAYARLQLPTNRDLLQRCEEAGLHR